MTSLRINSGDRIGSQLKGPCWTPYAQAIADCYPIQVPWFYTLPSNLTGGLGPLGRRTVLTSPQQHDVLILGASAIITEFFDVDEGNFLFLQVTHQETGIPWVVPNTIGAVPLPAIAPAEAPVIFPDDRRRTNTLKLPEAFFLPRYNRLKLDWQGVLSSGFPANAAALITFIGVQLIGAKSPREIQMPDKKTIRVGSRLPWFITIPLGRRIAVNDVIFENNVEYVQFTTPQNCDIEIHDIYHNTLNAGGVAVRNNTQLKLTVTRTEANWTPFNIPLRATAGDESKVDVALPFTRPLLLRVGQRLAVTEQLDEPGGFGAFQTMLTFRGVRLCKF